MSSFQGAAGAQKSGGFNSGPRQPRPGFQMRGRANARRGAGFGARGRGTSNAPTGAPSGPTNQSLGSKTGVFGGADSQQRFQLLKSKREAERKLAIRNGFLADPDKPRTLAEAITPTGTCPDKCAEFERVERIVQNDVWAQETKEDGSPDESRMVKKFRRAAAGIDEQLPSDLRPPSTLKRTCDYLFDELIGTADSLATVHHFVWDRTRAIRNDFSIQQVSKPADVEVAIDCYERIARFHILSLHQFAIPEKPYDKYDWYQEREQLDRTLLSLMQYYDDNRTRVDCKNEAEFRAYCVVFQIQDPIPDLEERVSCYPDNIRTDFRVRTALDLYTSACNILDPQGPLKPRAAHPVAKEDWNAFFTKIESNQVSYLMACVAEIYFNMVRRQVLNGIWRSFRRAGSSTDILDFPLDYLTDLLRFDDPDQTRTFCEHYGFGFKNLPDGSDEFLDLNSVPGKVFPQASAGLSAQIFSQSLVEQKRMYRTFPAVIRGYNVLRARNEGLISEEERQADEEMQMNAEQVSAAPATVPQSSTSGFQAAPVVKAPFAGFGANSNAASNPFQAAQSTLPTSPFASSGFTSAGFAPSQPATNAQSAGSTTPTGSPFAAPKGGLKDSAFAFGKPQPSPFSGFGAPSKSSWGAPTSPGGTSQTSQTPGQSMFAQPAQTAQSQQSPTSPNKPVMTSMHAKPEAPSWGNASSWGKPASPSVPPSSTAPAQSIFTASSVALTTEPKPAAQQSLPAFSFAKPAEPIKPASVPTEAPKFNFGVPAAEAAPAPSKPPTFSFGQPASSSATKEDLAPKPDGGQKSLFDFGNSVLTSKPAEQSSGFKFSTTPSATPAAEPASKPSFAFPSSGSTTAEKPQDDKPKMPTFSWGAATPSSDQPKTSPVEISGQSIFSPASNPSQAASKPFSFTTAKQPDNADPSSKPGQSQPPSQPAAVPAQAPPPQSSNQTQGAPPSSGPPSKSPTFTFSNPSQPKKRSPLSQSYTAEEDQPTPAKAKTVTFDTPPKSTFQATPTAPQTALPKFSTPQTNAAPAAPSQPAPVVAEPDLGSILQKLASEMITDADRGFLRQFVEYYTRPVIMSVYEDLWAEEMRELADKFRTEKLAKKYGRRWREGAWRLRLLRQGREKRQKRRTARPERPVPVDLARKRRLEEDAVDDFLKRRSVRAQQPPLNGNASTNGSEAGPRRLSATSTSTADVEMESVVTETAADTASSRDKMRSTAIAEPTNGNVADVPASPGSPLESIGRSSTYLGFSMPKQRSMLGNNATPRQPSRSTYFRMKAMGLTPNGTGSVISSMGPPPLPVASKKRARDDDSEVAAISPPHKRSKTPPSALRVSMRPRSNSNISQVSSVFRPSPARSYAGSVAGSTDDFEDDPILARARAARQALRQSTRSHVSQAPTGNEIGSPASPAATPSTSMERARQQARLRAAMRVEQSPARSVGSLDVPAYRLRESRFVPRENYSRAIERAREIQESRSRPGSALSARDVSVTPSVERGRRSDRASPLQDPGSVFDQPEATEEPVMPLQKAESQIAESVAVEHQPDVRYSVDPEPQQLEAPSEQLDQPMRDVSPEKEATPMQTVDEIVPDSFAMQPSDLGAEIDTQALSHSSYLDLGHDQSQTLQEQPSMYPDLHSPFNQAYPSFVQDATVNGDGFDSLAQEALQMNEFLQSPSEEQANPLHHPDISMSAEPLHVQPQIDPDLLGVTPSLPLLEIPASISRNSESVHQESDATDLEKDRKAPVMSKFQAVSVNPFAALADQDEEDSSSDDGSSVTSARNDGTYEDDGVSPSAEDEDEHFVSNGAIQDAQADVQELTPVEPTISFASSMARSTSVPFDDGPARHTRSKSRELSMSTAQKSGHLGEELGASFGSVQKHSLKESPIAEVSESEGEEPSNGIANGEADMATGEDVESASESVEDRAHDERVAEPIREDEEMEDEEEPASGEEDVEDMDDEENMADGEDEDIEGHVDGEDQRSYYSSEPELGSQEGDLEGGTDEEASDEERSDLGSDEEGYDYDSEDDEQYRSQSRGLTPGQMQQSGLVKGGTGQTAEDAFELSD